MFYKLHDSIKNSALGNYQEALQKKDEQIDRLESLISSLIKKDTSVTTGEDKNNSKELEKISFKNL